MEQSTTLTHTPGGWRMDLALRLEDRPGQLALAAEFIAAHKANIERFAYNRSKDPNMVRLAVCQDTAAQAGALLDALADQGGLALESNGPDKTAKEAAQGGSASVRDLSSLLTIKAVLEDRPGELARLAQVFKRRQANVIYMHYDGAANPGMAEISMSLESPEQLTALLDDLNDEAYHYHVAWSGNQPDAPQGIDAIIGLNAVETFLLKLKGILPREKLQALRALIDSSEEMTQALLQFRQEAGEDGQTLAASEVFSNILHLAATSIGKTGPRFSLTLSGPLKLSSEVTLYALACPTGANGYLLRCKDADVLMDSGYGLYFQDVRHWLALHGFDPGRIKKAYITHPDADHAGWAAPLEAELGCAIYMHPESAQVFVHQNRAHGTGTRLQALNLAFTRLITRFTDLRAPRSIHAFKPDSGQAGGFPVMGRFTVGDIEFQVLESLGGHVAGQVFFYAPQAGLLFCGDYLIDVKSLSDREKTTMSIPKYLMTSTNSESRIFSEEMHMLRELMKETHARLSARGERAWVFSGHGQFYSVDEAGW